MANLIPILLNNVYSTVQAGSSAIGSSSATGINVATGDGANFGTISTNQFIPAVVVDTSTSPETVKEYVWITSRSTDALTVVRQAEDSTRYAASTTTIQAGYVIAAVASKQSSLSAGLGYGTSSPGLHSLLGWTFDPAVQTWSSLGMTTAAFGTGFTVLQAVYIAAPCVITNMLIYVATGGSGLTGGYVGLYDQSGNRLGVSADQSTSWTSSGLKTVALSSAVTISAPGFYYAAYLPVGTTGPALLCVNNGQNNYTNVNMPANTFRRGSLSSQTTLTSTITLSSVSAGGSVLWFGLS